jgi:phage terminase large subunit-like protein
VYKDQKQGQEVTEQMKDGLVRPDKKSSGEKIDGVMASMMAIGVADSDEDGSVYEVQGLKQLETTPDVLGDGWGEDDD